MATASYASITVMYGSTASSAGMTNSIIASTGIINGDYQQLTGTFVVATTGDYVIGIHGVISVTPYYLSIDDLSLQTIESGTLQGTVSNPDEEPIDHATVSFSTYSTLTDINGYYHFAGVPVGTYDVTCSKTGYQTITAVGVPVTLNHTTVHNFAMQYQLDPPERLAAEIQNQYDVHLTWHEPGDDQMG